MNWIDIVVIIALAGAAFWGLRRGLIRMIFTLIGLVIGVVLALRYYASFAEWLSQYIATTRITEIIAFALILIGVFVAARVIASLLHRAISWMGPGWLNRLGGAIFGLVIGAIMVGALLAALVSFGFPQLETSLHDSAVAAWLLTRFPLVLALLPDEFDAVRSFFP